MELYNAVNNSNYTNPDDLTITTIEDVVYMGMKNDLSFLIGDVMNLYEHQSSFSPNLPLRGLFYFSSLYKEYIEPVKHRLYTASPLHIPFPKYVVFYNGTKKEPERQELKLSDLFLETKRKQLHLWNVQQLYSISIWEKPRVNGEMQTIKGIRRVYQYHPKISFGTDGLWKCSE